ncbi:esterase/lipase family protein [Qipengyuania marisflavi]|uniref:Alpha/beta fold hydrolase n=1 Tax=Qipengyuania marisflavi TaxID=2486356 RepID=A0A5S3PFP6_9SPHN|nr:alpha/beta fold hydrolase [Qipengyuania marisflavi]TMM50410.1 alpha/beta fold hydrolase [Qipengyuania marisflavi]
MADRTLFDPEVFNRTELSRRWSLAKEPCPDEARGPRAALLAQEMLWPLYPVKRVFGKLAVTPTANPRTVMLLPGFGAHPVRMRWMARQLEAAGHTAKRWGLGFNLGATAQRFAKVEQRLSELYGRAGEPIVLVGWSLGGVMAREIAKQHPDKVAKVITMGSPFSGSARANNGWRAYQAIAGHRVDEPEIDTEIAAKPPVETVAMWSPRDGIVNPRSASGRPGERDRSIALRCSHMGFVLSAEAVSAVLVELDRV